MNGLLRLSDDVLSEIVSYLEPRTPGVTGPWFCWRESLAQSNALAKAQMNTVRSLAFTCRRLYACLQGLRHRHLMASEHDRQFDLTRTVEALGDIKTRIMYADVRAEHGFEQLFWLPNIVMLTITEFNQTDAFEWSDQSHRGTSPVRTLRLPECGAHEAALADLLSWPAALNELWYDVDDGSWCIRYEDQEEIPFTCAALERCLAPHKDHLTKFVFTRPAPVHEGLGYDTSGIIDLSGFHRMTDLYIQHVWLCDLEPEAGEVRRHLPKNIETLQVFYDDHDAAAFIYHEANRPDWLFDILANKHQSTPALQRVRVISLEWDASMEEDDDDDNEDDGDEDDAEAEWPRAARQPPRHGSHPETGTVEGVSHPDKPWTPPQQLVAAFVQAGVSFSIFLHYKRWFRHVVEGSLGFDDSWEDSIEYWQARESQWQ